MIIKPKLFEDGRINYKIDYRQIETTNEEGKRVLMEKQSVWYFRLPFTFGKQITMDVCTDTGAYYRQ